MKFSDITSAVQDAWRFSWPPLVACVVAYGVSAFLYPSGVARAATVGRSYIAALGDSLTTVRALVEPFGLATVIPFVALVFVIAFLFLVNRAAMVWSSKLPPYLSYRPDRLLFDRMSTSEKVLLFRKYPTAEHLNAAYYMALQEYKSKGEPLRESSAENYYKLHNFVKFALVVAFVIVVIAVRNRDASLALAARLVAVVLVATVLWAVGLVGLLFQQEQQFSREWSAVRANFQPEAAKWLEKEVTPEEQVKIRAAVLGRWWRLYALDPYKVSWFRRTFLTRTSGPAGQD